MSSLFFNKSKAVADDFMQSVVFLDDRVYQRNGNEQDAIHDLDAFELTKTFAAKKKICAVYDPQSKSDIENFKTIASKADVVVLDWFIEIEENDAVVENLEEDDEADAEDQTVRGTYTKEIIENIVKINNDGLKVVLVYTGETDLEGIATEIHNTIPASTLDTVNCQVDYKKIKILVRAKSNNEDGEDNRFTHIPHLRDKVIKYEELPEFLLSEFTKLTEGLLSNFALKSLSTLRANTSKILGLYNKKLDHAYLEHKSAIPSTEDAEHLIIEIFKDSIGDLLHYKQVQNQISKGIVKSWMNDKIDKVTLSFKKKDGTEYTPEATFTRDKELLLSLLYSEEQDVQKKYIDIFTPLASKGKAEEFVKHLKLNNIELFINPSDLPNKAELISEFAKLTHHKNVFLPVGSKPILTLGTVLKSKLTGNYLICIQQKCDSVRILSGEQRKFLFLPLEAVTTGNFNFITHDNVKLKLGKKSYGIRTLKFAGAKDGVVKAVLLNGKFIFKQIYANKTDEKFEWVLDLKDLHSQRIVADYAATLSRVGLDESEWLRRSLG
ncbi:response regulator receiver domain [Mucilaginibacter sp. L3T2-6]|uniref:response regulator receiver domain n=1 Tax=Mucilaginibacter sp. L3T2-6 TaxID=3062491 RepID=UPI0026758A53|nr:response regulator receiver domain [Mucilaginibacter sp. L3T2-6]MDO3643494.1 response regulator receiver domain [Mucilaginibacter sp. L3T2-6]MDV6215945.1 response regulator receiver domain [Mucilaginibacter sp. L3T2-6]